MGHLEGDRGPTLTGVPFHSGAVDPVQPGTSFAPMAGFDVDRIAVPADLRLSSPPTRWMVLAALAFGLLFGALACVAGLASGVAHGVAHPAGLDVVGLPAEHAAHVAPMIEAAPSASHGDHGDRSEHPSTSGNHPGMACVVSVDLRFPEPTSPSISDSHEVLLLGLRSGHPADVDPPVPRCS